MEHSLAVADQISQIVTTSTVLVALLMILGAVRSRCGETSVETWISWAQVGLSFFTVGAVVLLGRTIESPIPMPISAGLGLHLIFALSLQSLLAIVWIGMEWKQPSRRALLVTLFAVVPVVHFGALVV